MLEWIINRQTFGVGGEQQTVGGGKKREWRQASGNSWRIRLKCRSQLDRISRPQRMPFEQRSGLLDKGITDIHDGVVRPVNDSCSNEIVIINFINPIFTSQAIERAPHFGQGKVMTDVLTDMSRQKICALPPILVR